MSAVTYKGKRRDGVACTGQTTDSPAVLIKRLFDQHWLWAIAERDGIEVGGIGFDEETGQDVWWGES